MSKKTTKRALAMSFVSVFLCVCMLVGTTFAWFTDSVTSSNNKIQAGKLDVELHLWNGTSYEDISTSTDPIFGTNSLATNSTNTLWEPGKTQVAYLAIKNNGNLALKYTVELNVQNVSKDLYKVMQYAVTPDAQPSSVTTWNGGESVVLGTQTVTAAAVEMAPGAEHYFALSIHMDELAGNEYQGGEVNFDLTVLANQAPVESDSFGTDYDKNAGVITVTPANVQDALNNAADNTVIQLTAGTYGKLMLQSAYVGEARTIKNLTIKGADGVNVAGIEVGNKTTLNNVVIDSINFTGEYDGFKCNVGDAAVDGLTINKCTMTDDGTAQFVSIKTPSPKNVKITNCTVDGAQRLITMVPSNNVTITGNTMKNLTVHGILLDNSGNRFHTGTIVIADNAYDRGAGECFIRIANLDATNTLVIKNNTVTNYMAGTSNNPYEDNYIKITTANNASVDGAITIMGNTASDASALGGHPLRGDLHITVNDVKYNQPVPQQ